MRRRCSRSIPLPLAGGAKGGPDCDTLELLAPSPPPAPPASGRGGLNLLPYHMAIHCAAHLFADGHLPGGLRNRGIFTALTVSFPDRTKISGRNYKPAHSNNSYGEPSTLPRAYRGIFMAPIFRRAGKSGAMRISLLRRLLARDEWGRGTAKVMRLAFYIRSHWLRMPPLTVCGICGPSGARDKHRL